MKVLIKLGGTLLDSAGSWDGLAAQIAAAQSAGTWWCTAAASR